MRSSTVQRPRLDALCARGLLSLEQYLDEIERLDGAHSIAAAAPAPGPAPGRERERERERAPSALNIESNDDESAEEDDLLVDEDGRPWDAQAHNASQSRPYKRGHEQDGRILG